MATHFPLHFTLENGTKVVVHKRDTNDYEFSLAPTHGAAQSFTYREGEHTKAEWDQLLNFEQLDALREFWLKTENVI
jgi:hypothetical protein